ncbi:MAG: hypothetical protein GY856_40625, partial [bacterium]|nr:hypothetical protein [bacterium]
RNLVEGHGLVFNPGERVEGYTNFLWVLLGAAWLKAGANAMAGLQWLSVVATLGLVAVVGRLDRLGGAASAVPALIWLLPLEAFGYWASTGMETMLFATLFTAAVYLGLREALTGRFLGSPLVFVLLALTRPEGVLCFALGLAGCALVSRLRRGGWPLRRLVRDGLVFGLAYGTYFAWRLVYYGELLPNTFQAKVTGGAEQWLNGLINLREWASTCPVFALTLLAPAVVLVSRRRGLLIAQPETLAVWVITVGWVAYVFLIGGDFMPYLRFFLPVLPLCAVLASRTLAIAAGELRGVDRHLGPIVIVLLLVQVGANLMTDAPQRAFVAHRTTVVGQEVGRYFAETLDHDDLIAVNTAGSLPYESALPTIDMLGLTDRAIARHPVYVVSPLWSGHRRGWGEYVLSRRPRAVVWYNTAGLREPHYLGDHQLADSPFFRFFYQLRPATLPGPAARERDRVLARFLGTPFGDEATSAVSPNLGVRFEIRETPIRHTVAFAAPVTLHYFELRRDHEPFWPHYQASGGDLGHLLAEVLASWRDARPRRLPVDPAARRDVEALCRRALFHLEQGETGTAKTLLSEAARRNAAARFPLVYQYIANLAVLEKDLFLAVHAQQEALRLDPDNELYRRNLKHLLQVPFREFQDRSG